MMHEQLKKFFQKKGISQLQLAEILEVKPQYVNAILNGKKAIGKKTAEKIANFFGLSKSFLLTGEGELLQSDDVVQVPVCESTADMVELYAQRIRLVDDLRQSLREELQEIRTIKSELSEARDTFINASVELRRIISQINNQSSIGIAAEDITK